MSAEEDIDIDNLLLTRANWRPFCPLIHQRNFMTIDHQIARCLDNEIADTYNDLRLRKIDVIDKRVQMKELRKVLLDPKVEEYMNSMVPKQGNNPDFKITDFHYYDSISLSPRNIKTFKVFVNVEFRDGRQMAQDRQSRSILEDSYCVFLGEYIRNQKIYSKYSCERELDALKMIKRFPTKTFSIGFVYDNRVPCAVMTSMFIRACETFYPQLMPLTFYWQSVMSEVWSEDYSRRFFDSKWMSIEKVCLLVIFFLQHCQLVPQIMRESNVFIPHNITWELVEKWDKGEPFFTKEYYAVKRKEISKSPFFNKSVGEMFAALVNFYITTLPLGDWAIELDRGCVGAVEHVQDVPIYSVLQWTFIFDPVFRDKIVIFRKIMRAIRQFLAESKGNMLVSFELYKIRYKIQCENRVLWEAGDWYKRINYEIHHVEDDASSTRTFTQKKYDSTQQNNSLEQALSDEESGALKQEATVLAKTANESAKENATKKTQWQKKNGKKKKNKRYL